MNRQNLIGRLLALLSVSLLAAGCASSTSSSSFPRSTARTGFDILYGEVVSISIVEIEGEASGIGQIGGTAVGAAIGRGDSNWYGGFIDVGTAAGGVAGAILGELIERKAKTADGYQIVVALDRSDTIAVVQAMDVEFTPGDRVQVLYGADGSRRVQHF